MGKAVRVFSAETIPGYLSELVFTFLNLSFQFNMYDEYFLAMIYVTSVVGKLSARK